jgi:transcriptional regulator with XRE-family HTH domain
MKSRHFLDSLQTGSTREEDCLPRLAKNKTPVDQKAIAVRLRELRKRRGLSQTQVAQALGVHQSLVSEYERATVRVPSSVMATLAQLLRISSDQILGLKPLKESGAFKDRRFIRRLERIEQLPKRAKQTLLGTIDTFLSAYEKR